VPPAFWTEISSLLASRQAKTWPDCAQESSRLMKSGTGRRHGLFAERNRPATGYMVVGVSSRSAECLAAYRQGAGW
jgi:hypothetical protein